MVLDFEVVAKTRALGNPMMAKAHMETCCCQYVCWHHARCFGLLIVKFRLIIWDVWIAYNSLWRTGNLSINVSKRFSHNEWLQMKDCCSIYEICQNVSECFSWWNSIYIIIYIYHIYIYLHHLSLSIFVNHIISYIDCKALNSVESLIIDRPQYLSHFLFPPLLSECSRFRNQPLSQVYWYPDCSHVW